MEQLMKFCHIFLEKIKSKAKGGPKIILILKWLILAPVTFSNHSRAFRTTTMSLQPNTKMDMSSMYAETLT